LLVTIADNVPSCPTFLQSVWSVCLTAKSKGWGLAVSIVNIVVAAGRTRKTYNDPFTKGGVITNTKPIPFVADQSFLGHPKGLFFLAFTEAWERFSFYGMTALLVLYMVNQLLLRGHVENIAGFSAFRSALESLAGPLSPVALASLMFGLYSGFVYFTPVFGGLIADRWIGQRNAVVIGALSMSSGHIAMAFERTFLLALLLLIIGSGFLKGNISTKPANILPAPTGALSVR
jgi:dipeptide/tripeptide permease